MRDTLVFITRQWRNEASDSGLGERSCLEKDGIGIFGQDQAKPEDPSFELLIHDEHTAITNTNGRFVQTQLK